MNSNPTGRVQMVGSPYHIKRIVPNPQSFPSPRDNMKVVEVQFRPKFIQQIPQPQHRIPVHFNDSGSQSRNSSLSRHHSTKNLLASPQAKRPNINLVKARGAPVADNYQSAANEAAQLYLGESSYPSTPTNRDTHSSRSNQRPRGLETSTLTQNSSAASLQSSTPVCCNGDNKKGRYCIKGSPYEVFCAKCAINLIEKNVQVQEIDATVGQHSERQKQLRETELNAQGLSGKIKDTLDQMALRRNSIAKTFQEQEGRIRSLYNRLRQTVEESEHMDVARVLQLRNSLLASFESREAELTMAFSRIDGIRQQVEAIRLPSQPLTENDYAIKRSSLDKQLKKIMTFLQDCEQDDQPTAFPKLRESPMFEGSYITFLQPNSRISTTSEFSFHERLLPASNPHLHQQNFVTD